MFEHAVVVQLPKKPNIGNSSLVKFEIILLKTEGNGFQDQVYHPYDK